jgi:hypothetical protein
MKLSEVWLKLLACFDSGWRIRRCIEVRRALVEDGEGKCKDEPHILNGTFYWKNMPSSVEIDIFFPNKPLAIVIADRGYKRFGESSTVISRRVWKNQVAHTSFNVRACRLAKIPVVFISPDDPIDPNSLALAVDEAFVLQKVVT